MMNFVKNIKFEISTGGQNSLLSNPQIHEWCSNN